MFSFDAQITLMRAWSDMALGCMTAAAQISQTVVEQSVSALAAASTGKPTSAKPEASGLSWSSGQSWYRAPNANPFEFCWPGMAMPFPFAPPMLAMTPQTVIRALDAFQTWSRQMQPAAAFPAPLPASWMGWPVTPYGFAPSAPWMSWMSPSMFGMPSAPVAPSPQPAGTATFATYRSSSGHAVAQIKFPNDIVATVAMPPSTASLLDALLPWPRMLH